MRSSGKLQKLCGLGCWLGIALGCARSALAQPLEQPRAPGYYLLHTGLTLSAFAAGGALSLFAAPRRPGLEPFPHFGPDVSVRSHFSDSAASLSDRVLGLEITFPLAAQLSEGFNTPFANAGVIYAEAQALNFLLTLAAKVSVRRPRPYTQSPAENAKDFSCAAGSDAYASFFSGHSSTTYTAAMAGSVLYAARTRELGARHVMWGLEFSLAAFTAQLRVRAGRHYRTDVWIGSAVGAGVGLLVPAVHGIPLSRVHASEWATGAGAAAATIVLTELVDVCQTLDLCKPEDSPPGSSSSDEAPAAGVPEPSSWLRWRLAPLVFDVGSAGLSVEGDW